LADYDIPDDLRYSREDEWARREAGRVVIGITDYAQQLLGDIVFVELPEVGSHIDRGESFGVVESVKAVSDLFAPITGEVLETNQSLADNPDSVNSDCYGDGWILAVALEDQSEWEALLDPSAYQKHVEERAD
jgi:glycine cleavage system H protein